MHDTRLHVSLSSLNRYHLLPPLNRDDANFVSLYAIEGWKGESMRILVVAALLGTTLVAAPASQTSQEVRASDSLERAFAPDGRIKMDLSAGDYRISAGQDTRIRVQWSVRDPNQLSKVLVRADVQRHLDANISTAGPSNGQLKVVIQVPAQADLYIRLTAGDLRVEDIRGNKDVELHAGDIDIDVGRPEDYHHVEASVWAGDLTATPFRISKGGLFRSFDWNGNGPYRLHARLKAGDLRLYSKSVAVR
jgi:hypothetical protein